MPITGPKELSDDEINEKANKIGQILNGINIKEVDRVILRFQGYLRYNTIVNFAEPVNNSSCTAII